MDDRLLQAFAVQPGGACAILEAPARKHCRSRGINAVFDGLDTTRKFGYRFAALHCQSPLQNSRAAIQLLGNEMHGTPMPLLAGVKYALVGIEPWVGGQQGWMYVQNPAAVTCNKPRTQNAHESGKNQQVGSGAVEFMRHRLVKRFAIRVLAVGQATRRDARFRRSRQADSVVTIAQDLHDVERQFAARNLIYECLQITS